jgi:uncharacterized membrane protein YczE
VHSAIGYRSVGIPAPGVCSIFAAPIQRARQQWIELSTLLFGPLVIAAGFVMNIQANVGQGPWQALHVGIALWTPLSVGVATQVVGIVVLAAAWALGVRPGWGTAFNILLVGIYTDLLLLSQLIPWIDDPVYGFIMVTAGALVASLGTALYVKAQIGKGPRDGLMVALANRSRLGPGLIRTAMDGLALLFGWLLGAPVGPGTVLFVVLLGPSVTLWIRILRFSR